VKDSVLNAHNTMQGRTVSIHRRASPTGEFTAALLYVFNYANCLA